MAPEEKTTSSRLSRIIEAARLKDISLKSINANCLLNPYVVEPEKTELKRSNSVQVETVENFLYCFVSYTIEGKKKEVAEDKDVFSIEMCFSIVYDIEGFDAFDIEDIKLFGRTNSVYNAYPFVRETIQTIMQRMSLPVFRLPLLKPPTRKQVDNGGKEIKRIENK